MKNDGNTLISDIKNNVTLREVWEHEDVVEPREEIPSNGMVSCIFHEDSNPSMYIADDYCYCHVCTQSWDILAFSQKLLDLDFKETLDWFSNNFKNELSPSVQGEGVKVKTTPMKTNNEGTSKMGRPKKKTPAITQAEYNQIIKNTSPKGNNYRGISDKVLAKSKVRTEYNEEGEVVARYYPGFENNKLVGYKKRICDKKALAKMDKDKAFFSIGRIGVENSFYGEHLYKGYTGTLFIVGGEEDREAADTMINSSHFKSHWKKPAVVSCSAGEGNLKSQIKARYSFLKQFDEVVLALDSDDPGLKAMEECAPLVPKGCNVYTVKWSSYKDPNDYLKNNAISEFISQMFAKVRYVPKGIVSSSDIDKDLVEELLADRVGFPPFQKKMQDMCLGGLPLNVVVNLAGVSGGGKCLGVDTPVLMHDGSVKKVQDVEVGDKLMGDDGSPRNVLTLARGKEPLYLVQQNKGMDYVVNESHILSLRAKSTVVDISVKDYLELPKAVAPKYKGYKANLTLFSEGDGSHPDTYESEIVVSKITDSGDYYGFEIDGNRRFCLGDFTVTHNTTVVNEMINHWIFNSPYKCMPVSFELSRGQYAEAMYSRHLGIRLNKHRDRVQEILEEKKEEIMRLKYTDNGDPRFYLIDDRDLTIEDLKDKTQEAVSTLGVQFIIYDPLNDLFDGLDLKDQQDWMRWEKQFVKTNPATILNVCHLSKAGSELRRDKQGVIIPPGQRDFDGASHIFKSGAINISIVRDVVNNDPLERNTTYAAILKGRGGIETGRCGSWYYNPETHTMVDREEYDESQSIPEENEEGKGQEDTDTQCDEM